jgi:ribonuclease HI
MTTRDSVPQPGEIRIVTDGACRGNPGPGGWAAMIWRGEQVEEIGGQELHTTNNRMELRAAVEALRRVPPAAAVRIVTDSSYLVNGATSWLAGWKRRGWLTTSGQPVEHRELWEELDRLAGQRVRWEQVRGHAGHPENERADVLAQAFADGRPSPPRALRPAGGSAGAGGWPAYLSLVDGRLMRHRTWDECRARVHGVSGARFKKCATYEDALATLDGWGLAPAALDR